MVDGFRLMAFLSLVSCHRFKHYGSSHSASRIHCSAGIDQCSADWKCCGIPCRTHLWPRSVSEEPVKSRVKPVLSPRLGSNHSLDIDGCGSKIAVILMICSMLEDVIYSLKDSKRATLFFGVFFQIIRPLVF